MIRRVKVVLSLVERLMLSPVYFTARTFSKGRKVTRAPFPLVFVICRKDFDVLVNNLAAMRAMGMLSGLTEVVLFVPEGDYLEAINRFLDCRVEIENVLGVCKSSFDQSLYASPNWLYQQALKLSLDNYFGNVDILILDGDTCIDTRLFTQTLGYTFRYAYENYEGYKLTYMDLGYSRKKRSYISHHSFFNTLVLKEIRRRLKEFSGTTFEDGIVGLSNKNSGYFSEYELIYCEMERVFKVESAPFFLDNWGLFSVWSLRCGLLEGISEHNYRKMI